MGELSIKKFDIAGMRTDRACVLVGASGTGKSHLATELLGWANKICGGITGGLIFCGTHAGDPYWNKFCPDTFIYDAFDKEKVEELIAIQMRYKRKIDQLNEMADMCQRRGDALQAQKHRHSAKLTEKQT